MDLLRRLVSIPGPPGQEDDVRRAVAARLDDLGVSHETDPKGNLLARLGPADGEAHIVVTAHLDEIALIVRSIRPDGRLAVSPLGGVHPWKWGEGPVEILPLGQEPIPGVLSFGSMHTEDPSAVGVQAREAPLRWEQTTVFTGMSAKELEAASVHPGVRVVIARSRREVVSMGQFVGSYFLDDRADVVAWLMVIETLRRSDLDVPILFAATTSEEVGGEGVRWLLHGLRPTVCVALELGPLVPDSDVVLSEIPTVWVKDGYAATHPTDLSLIRDLGVPVQWQALSRGGSDATCAAAIGLCARPVTLGLPMENTHGFEIMHVDAIDRLADLTTRYLQRVALQLTEEVEKH
jgi:putative aminopeptidase FrvX